MDTSETDQSSSNPQNTEVNNQQLPSSQTSNTNDSSQQTINESIHTEQQSPNTPPSTSIPQDNKWEKRDVRIAFATLIITTLISAYNSYLTRKQVNISNDQYIQSLEESKSIKESADSSARVALKESIKRDSIYKEDWKQRINEFKTAKKADSVQQSAFLSTLKYYEKHLDQVIKTNDLYTKANSAILYLKLKNLNLVPHRTPNTQGTRWETDCYIVTGNFHILNASNTIPIDEFEIKYATLSVFSGASSGQPLKINKTRWVENNYLAPKDTLNQSFDSECFTVQYNHPRVVSQYVFIVIQYRFSDRFGVDNYGGEIFYIPTFPRISSTSVSVPGTGTPVKNLSAVRNVQAVQVLKESIKKTPGLKLELFKQLKDYN